MPFICCWYAADTDDQSVGSEDDGELTGETSLFVRLLFILLSARYRTAQLKLRSIHQRFGVLAVSVGAGRAGRVSKAVSKRMQAGHAVDTRRDAGVGCFTVTVTRSASAATTSVNQCMLSSRSNESRDLSRVTEKEETERERVCLQKRDWLESGVLQSAVIGSFLARGLLLGGLVQLGALSTGNLQPAVRVLGKYAYGTSSWRSRQAANLIPSLRAIQPSIHEGI